MSYPPAPWSLTATLQGSVFLLPEDRLPTALFAAMPDLTRPLWIAGRAAVAAVVVDYTEPGVLTYRELMLAVLGLRGRRPVITIGEIWVDSAASRAGGRELWRIPKEMGDFETYASDTATYSALRVDDVKVAELVARDGRLGTPGRLGVPLITAQRLAGRNRITRSRLVGGIRLMRARWRFDPDGPLGCLAGRRPWLSLSMPRAAVTFGIPRKRS